MWPVISSKGSFTGEKKNSVGISPASGHKIWLLSSSSGTLSLYCFNDWTSHDSRIQPAGTKLTEDQSKRGGRELQRECNLTCWLSCSPAVWLPASSGKITQRFLSGDLTDIEKFPLIFSIQEKWPRKQHYDSLWQSDMRQVLYVFLCTFKACKHSPSYDDNYFISISLWIISHQERRWPFHNQWNVTVFLKSYEEI